MAATRVGVFDKTVEKTNAWLSELETTMGWEDRNRTYMALRAVLHTLRDRLPPDEAVDLAAQLPMLIRGFYYEGWHPADKPLKYRNKDEFLQRATKEVPWLQGDELERAVTAVFGILERGVSQGETAQVRRMLPPELRELWAQPGL